MRATEQKLNGTSTGKSVRACGVRISSTAPDANNHSVKKITAGDFDTLAEFDAFIAELDKCTPTSIVSMTTLKDEQRSGGVDKSGLSQMQSLFRQESLLFGNNIDSKGESGVCVTQQTSISSIVGISTSSAIMVDESRVDNGGDCL